MLEIEGERGALLSYERVGLNLLQRMSGIATMTHDLQERVRRRNPATSVVGTRKTPWGLLDKRALHLGGGGTHRLGLGDAILVKNNHLALLADREEEAAPRGRAAGLELSRGGGFYRGGSAQQGRSGGCRRRRFASCGKKIPRPALAGCCWTTRRRRRSADILQALRADHLLEHVLIEASGNISEANAEEYADSGVDAVSSGALTHSARALDISQKL